MMVLLNFLTSRGFAVFLLCISIGLLVLWNVRPGFYSTLFLIPPALVFLSVALCTGRRFVNSGGRRGTAFRGSMVFHAGLLIVIAATAAGPLTRFHATAILPEGVRVGLDDEKFTAIHSTPAGGEAPRISLLLDWQETRYEEERFPVEYAAGLRVGLWGEGGYSQTEETIKVNAPLRKGGYQLMLIGGLLSPRFVLRDGGGGELFSRFVELSDKAGVEDSFNVEAAGLTVYTRFFPDVFEEDGRYGTRSPQPRNPAFGIKVATKEDPFGAAWSGVLKEGERAEFDGMTLEFAELKPVVVVSVTNDPTYSGIFAGWLFIVTGLIVRYLPSERSGGRKVKSFGDGLKGVETGHVKL